MIYYELSVPICEVHGAAVGKTLILMRDPVSFDPFSIGPVRSSPVDVGPAGSGPVSF